MTRPEAELGYEIRASHVDEDGVTVITDMRLMYVSLLPEAEMIGGGRVVSVERAIDPVDKDVPLPALPTNFTPSDLEIQRAVNSWNDKMGDFEDLLDSKVVE